MTVLRMLSILTIIRNDKNEVNKKYLNMGD